METLDQLIKNRDALEAQIQHNLHIVDLMLMAIDYYTIHRIPDTVKDIQDHVANMDTLRKLPRAKTSPIKTPPIKTSLQSEQDEFNTEVLELIRQKKTLGELKREYELLIETIRRDKEFLRQLHATVNGRMNVHSLLYYLS